MIAAIVAAVHDGKVANLLIGAAMVASSAVIFNFQMDRRLGDVYDSGKHAERRAIVREVGELIEPRD